MPIDWTQSTPLPGGALLRRCGLPDLDTLRTLARETCEEAFGSQNSTANMAAYLDGAFNPQTLAAELTNPASAFYFLLVDGRPAGYLKLNVTPAQSDLQEPHTLEVQRIYVRRACAKRGLGGALLRFAEQEARRLGKTALWLGVWEHNHNAIGFYTHCGYTQSGSHPYPFGDDLQTDWIMRKSLG